MNQNNQAMAMMQCDVSGMNILSGNQAGITTTTAINNTAAYYEPQNSLWGYWQGIYYPQVIRESYPVYIQEKAMDKGKHAFELLKALMDKKLLKIEKVSEFIEAMDTILKTL